MSNKKSIFGMYGYGTSNIMIGLILGVIVIYGAFIWMNNMDLLAGLNSMINFITTNIIPVCAIFLGGVITGFLGRGYY